MKKMLAACAALMVVGFVSADITSDNIVGYTAKTSVSGFNWLAPQFSTVGATTIDLSDITLTGDGVGNGGESLAILDEGGAPVGDPYVFWSKDVTGEENDCWFDFNEWSPITGVTIGGGDGVLLSAGAGVTVTIKVPYTL